MKQKFLLKTMLLLFALMGGVNSAWGTEGDEITSISNIVDGKSYYIKGVRSSTTYYLTFTDAVGSQSGTESLTTAGAQLITFHLQSSGSYTLETASGNYIAPGTSNGKINVSASKINVTVSNQSSKIRLSITSGSSTWSIQKNTGAANFGGYKNTQTDITLIEGPSSSNTPSITLATSSIDAPETAVSTTSIEVIYNNLTNYNADVIFYEANGTTLATYDHSWMTAEINPITNNLDYSITANTGAARTAYLRVYAMGEGDVEVESDLITVTQAAHTYTITAASNNNNYGTVSLEGNVITGNPTSGYRYASPAYTVSSGTAAVVQNGNEFTVTPSSDCTVTINFEAIPCYTVTLSDDTGNPTTEYSPGVGVTLPERSAIGDFTFAGWSPKNVSSETTTAPTIIPAGTYYPTANITLYPVYTRTEGSAPTAFAVGNTGNFAIVSAQQGEKYYALPTNPTVSSGKITAQEITVSELSGVKYVTSANASGFTWTIATATNGYTLSDGSKYIYHSNGGDSGTNLTYGTSTSYTWAFTADGDYVTMAGMSGSTTNSRGMLFNGTTIGGYALSNATNSGYYKVMILPISSGSTTYYWSSPVVAAESDLTKEDDITLDFKSAGYTANIADYYTSSSDGAFTYEVADETVASISEGVVTGLKVGTTTITVSQAATSSYEAGVITIGVTVTDTRTIPSISFSDADDMISGNLQTIVVTTTHTGVRSVVSSDEDIVFASINGSGNIELLAGDKAGKATITLTIAENVDYKEASGSFDVNVDDGKSDPSITISSNELGINAVKTFTLTSNSEGAITISTDNDHAELEDNGDGTFNLTSDTEGTVIVNVSQAANGSYRAYETTFNISVVDNRTTPTFSFSDASKVVEWEDRGDFVKPTLTNTSDATVAYTSSNTGVATVDSNGDITFVAGGTTTITASVSGSANYKDAQASYTLTVNKPFEFTETFASITGTGAASTSNFDNSGWTSSGSIYGNSGNGIRMAKGDGAGSITTPALTGMPTNAKMTFKAQGWDSDETTISISGTNCTVSPTSFTNLSYSSFDECTAYITVTGDNPKITFSAASGVRIKLDDITITDLPNATISISNVELRAGETAKASITTNNETGAFTFVSSDETVATVAKVGDDYVVTGVAEGTATITATQAGNTYYKTTSTTFTVSVISATAVMNPTLSVATGATVEVGDHITIDAEEGCTIKYTTDNTDPTESGTATSVNTNTASVTVPTGVNSLTLKAVAKNGDNFSEVVTATYNVVKKTLNASFASDAIEVAIGGNAAEPALTNPDGGTVTWESSNTDVATVDAEGQLTAIAEGTATITASIAATDTYKEGTATYEVTVYDPSNIVVDFNNDPFGIGNIYEQDASLSYTYKGITFDFAKGSGNTNPRVDGNVSDKVARLYTGNTLSVTAPIGYAISTIVFDFNKGSVTIGDDTYSKTEGTTWEGLQTPVQITGSETSFINKMTITLTEAEQVTVTASGYLSYCSPHKLNFSQTVVKAYKASVNNTTATVRLTQVNVVPAGEGVVLFSSEAKAAAEAKTYSIPVTTEEASDVTGNEMVGVLERTQVSWNPSTGVYNYILQQGQFNKATGGYLKANRAYLSTDFDVSAGNNPQARMAIVFNDETTGISTMQNAESLMDNVVYDLQGRRVETPRKGSLYIVSGKKVVF